MYTVRCSGCWYSVSYHELLQGVRMASAVYIFNIFMSKAFNKMSLLNIFIISSNLTKIRNAFCGTCDNSCLLLKSLLIIIFMRTAEVFQTDMTYWQSPLSFCGLLDFFASRLASESHLLNFRWTTLYYLMTFWDTLCDGSGFGKLTSLK